MKRPNRCNGEYTSLQNGHVIPLGAEVKSLSPGAPLPMVAPLRSPCSYDLRLPGPPRSVQLAGPGCLPRLEVRSGPLRLRVEQVGAAGSLRSRAAATSSRLPLLTLRLRGLPGFRAVSFARRLPETDITARGFQVLPPALRAVGPLAIRSWKKIKCYHIVAHDVRG